jgi:hypothetical protein
VEPERSQPPLSQNPAYFFLVGIAGFLFGIGLVLLGAGRTDRSDAFVHTTGFAVWAATIGVQTAYWAVTIGPLWAELRDLWRRAASIRLAILALAGTLVLILVVLPYFSSAAQIDWPLWSHSTKTRTLTIIGGITVGVPALLGIALAQRELNELEPGTVAQSDIVAAIRARTRILRFLSIAGAVIGLAVLAAGALRKAAVPRFVPDDTFPQEGVMMYGAFFTGLLLLVYAPAHVAVRRFGARVRDHYFPLLGMPTPDSDAFKGWLDRRAALESLLQLNVSPSQQLQASLFILAPLLSAVITTLVPKPT